MRLREPHGFGDLRVGRFVVATGAIRPIQIDGASALARAPWGSTVEAFGGVPVVPSFGARPYDWVIGARIAQAVASRMTAGASFVRTAPHGEIADDEVGADLAAVPVPGLDGASRAAYDVTSPGIADALISAAVRKKDFRVELFATHRSPSRLLARDLVVLRARGFSFRHDGKHGALSSSAATRFARVRSRAIGGWIRRRQRVGAGPPSNR